MILGACICTTQNCLCKTFILWNKNIPSRIQYIAAFHFPIFNCHLNQSLKSKMKYYCWWFMRLLMLKQLVPRAQVAILSYISISITAEIIPNLPMGSNTSLERLPYPWCFIRDYLQITDVQNIPCFVQEGKISLTMIYP